MITFAFMLPTRDGAIIGATDDPLNLDYSLVWDYSVWEIIARVEPAPDAGGPCYTLIRAELPRGAGVSWSIIQARRELAGRLDDGELTPDALEKNGMAPTTLIDSGELRILNGHYTDASYAA